MSSFNKVILMGNLVADPETRTTQTGSTIAKFTLAVNRRYTSQSGDAKEEVSYVDVDAFSKQADTIAQYLSKGRPILVEGRLRQNRWETPQGDKRNKLVVVLERFTFVGRKDDAPANVDDTRPANVDQGENMPQKTPNNDAPEDHLDNDDIPF